MKEKVWISISSRNNFWWHNYSSLDLNSSNSNYLTILPQVGKHNFKLACTLGEHLRSKFSDLVILSLCDKLRKSVKKKLINTDLILNTYKRIDMKDRDRRQTDTREQSFKCRCSMGLQHTSLSHHTEGFASSSVDERSTLHSVFSTKNLTNEWMRWHSRTALTCTAVLPRASPWTSPACHFKAASKLWNLPILAA